MHDPLPNWLRLLPLGLGALLLVGAAATSLEVIHLRQEQAHLAASTTKLRSDLYLAGLRYQEVTATIAAAEQPDALRARIGSALAPVTDKQIYWVGPAPAAMESLRFAQGAPARAPASAPSTRFASAHSAPDFGLPQ
ncbi:MAG TPA: hypothetical protein VHC95_08355 [Opitutales bacterium]|nr:hypothetical protein [Opitutales bacterium]